jgi:hypothetical protein
MVMVGFEAWSCVDPVYLGLCVNLELCGCVTTLNHVPFFNELIYGLGILETTHLVTMLLT